MKYLVFITISVYSVALIFLLFLFRTRQDDLRPVVMNDIIYTIRDEWPDVAAGMKLLKRYDIDYIVFDNFGNQIGSTNQKFSDLKMEKIHYGLCSDIIINNKTVGKIIFVDDSINKELAVHIFGVTVLSISFMFSIIIYIYIYKNILKPVKNISLFAKQIANGNLDISIQQFDSKYFGVLSESFNILREELIFSKKREREADKNRREVIASISHDIKNPVASIQALAEYQYLTITNEEQKADYQTIVEKTNQINGLIANLHTSMLDDLGKLTVNPVMEESRAISIILKQSDYRKLLNDFQIPECLILLDRGRFQQVVDNIISNSYKYANTSLQIYSYYKGDYLCICIRDYGPGVLKEEEIFLTQKYFRGKNVIDKEGSGIGLYIAENLIKGMNGKIEFFTNEGLEVRIYLALVI